MKINNELIESILGLKLTEIIDCENLGLSYQDIPNMLSFMDSEKFVQQMLDNKNVKAIFVTEKLSSFFDNTDILKIICDDPRYYFYTLKNYISKENYKKFDSKIHPTAKIHPRAYVCEYNVEIGENVILEPNVTILADVVIGNDCIIRAGTVIGSEGFEYKKTSRGLLAVFHDGKVVIGNRVEIGSNTSVDKGFKNGNTIIEDDVKIDNLIHVAHSVKIGKNSLIVACSMLGGSSDIGENSWIGPNASLSSQINVGKNGFVTMGAVVTRNVEEGQIVSGNFAIEHSKLIQFIKTIR